MAQLGRLRMKLEMEPVVLLRCEEVTCVHNLVYSEAGMYACNLKHVAIVRGGVCREREGRAEVGEKRAEVGL